MINDLPSPYTYSRIRQSQAMRRSEAQARTPLNTLIPALLDTTQNYQYMTQVTLRCEELLHHYSFERLVYG